MNSHLNDEGPGTLCEPGVREALQELKARYFYYVDSRQWDRLRSVFTDDAKSDGFGFEGEGPDAFVEGVKERLDGAVSFHAGFMPQFSVQQDGSVRGRWAMHDYVTWPPGHKTYRGVHSSELSGFRGFGYYEEVYRKNSEGWRVSFIRLTRIRTDLLYGERPTTVDLSNALAPDTNWIL